MADLEEIKRIAHIARLDFSDEELANFSNEFDDVLQIFNSIRDIDTSSVPLSILPVNINANLRKDVVEKCSLHLNGYVQGPKVMEQ